MLCIDIYVLQMILRYDLQVQGSTASLPTALARTPKESKSEGRETSAKASTDDKSFLRPSKRAKQEEMVSKPSEAAGSLAFEDDFFLDADNADAPNASPTPVHSVVNASAILMP